MCEILQGPAMEAKTHVQNCELYLEPLRILMGYLRTDHVGMIRGDGDLTRYMVYLVNHASSEAKGAVKDMDAANIPDCLPF